MIVYFKKQTNIKKQRRMIMGNIKKKLVCIMTVTVVLLASSLDSEANTKTRQKKSMKENNAQVQKKQNKKRRTKASVEMEDRKSEYAPSLSSYNTISLNLLGAGILYGLGYSHRFGKSPVLNLGISYYSASASAGDTSVRSSVLIIPAYFSYLIGDGNHYFEPLGGVDFVSASASVSSGAISGQSSGFGIVPIIGAGYRYWPDDGGFHFRATLYMFIGSSVAVWPGISLGYAF